MLSIVVGHKNATIHLQRIQVYQVSFIRAWVTMLLAMRSMLRNLQDSTFKKQKAIPVVYVSLC